MILSMGIGDDIIFLGEAEKIHQQTGKKITPLYGTGLNSMYDNVEFITPHGGLTVNARSYIAFLQLQKSESLPMGCFSAKPTIAY